MVHNMPLKIVFGQSYKATIRTLGSSLVFSTFIKLQSDIFSLFWSSRFYFNRKPYTCSVKLYAHAYLRTRGVRPWCE